MALKKSSVVVVGVTAIGGKKKASTSSGSFTAISKANREPPMTCNKMKSETSYLVKPLNHYEKKCSTKKDPSHETST